MSKKIIYYSDFNLDNCFAAMMLCSFLKRDNNDNVDTVNYSRSDKFVLPKLYDEIYILGNNIHPIHLESIIYKNPNAVIILYSFNPEKYFSQEILSKINVIKNEICEEDNTHYYSDLSSFVYNDLFKSDLMFETVFPNIHNKTFKDLFVSINKYNKFNIMNDITELLFVQKNIKNVMNVLEIGSIFIIEKVKTLDHQKYIRYIEKIRAIINRNFCLKFLLSESKHVNVPVLNVAHEQALAVMRLVSYSYSDVITYEDNATFRLYRIFSKLNKDWYLKAFKADDFWYEDTLLFIKTALPIQENK